MAEKFHALRRSILITRTHRTFGVFYLISVPDYKFDREFMAWARSGIAKNMGDVADEWTRRAKGG